MSVEWYYEGNVVNSVVTHLRQEGWSIKSVANTDTRERGADISAERDGQLLIVEAKGYPLTVYARGLNKGMPKPTKPNVQARHWFSHVLLDAILRQSEFYPAIVAIALPRFPIFTSLLTKTDHALKQMRLGVYLVGENGEVQILIDAKASTQQA